MWLATHLHLLCRAPAHCAWHPMHALTLPPLLPPCSGTGPLLFAVLFSLFTKTDSPLPYFPGGWPTGRVGWAAGWQDPQRRAPVPAAPLRPTADLMRPRPQMRPFHPLPLCRRTLCVRLGIDAAGHSGGCHHPLHSGRQRRQHRAAGCHAGRQQPGRRQRQRVAAEEGCGWGCSCRGAVACRGGGRGSCSGEGRQQAAVGRFGGRRRQRGSGAEQDCELREDGSPVTLLRSLDHAHIVEL